MKLDEANITVSDTSNTIPVSRTDFVLPGDRVLIQVCDPETCCQLEYQRTVVSIGTGSGSAANNIVVDGDPIQFFANSVTQKCDNKVIRLYRPYEYCDEIVGRQVLDEVEDKITYFQNFAETITFTTPELNICYAH